MIYDLRVENTNRKGGLQWYVLDNSVVQTVVTD